MLNEYTIMFSLFSDIEMETLAVEMVEVIVQLLTPPDLARCSAVSRQWREVFNKDWVWKPHCDPGLEHPLQTIPCVATPPFETPETENSTLQPICHWKLAFMKEKHLWEIWRRFSGNGNKKNELDWQLTGCERVDFLTDTLVLVIYSARIEILDVSVIPAVLVAKSINAAVNIAPWHKYVFRFSSNTPEDEDKDRGTLLGSFFVLTEYSLTLFGVDVLNRSIYFKDVISLGNIKKHAIKDDLYIGLTNDSLVLFDLKTGKTLKKEPFPAEAVRSENTIFELITSPSSDFVAVCFKSKTSPLGGIYSKYYIYSLKLRIFSMAPVVDKRREIGIELHGQYFALFDSNVLTINSCLTEEVLLRRSICGTSCDRVMDGGISFGFNDAFIFLDYENGETWLRIYFPSSRTLTPIFKCEDPRSCYIKTINNKFIAELSLSKHRLESLWEVSQQSMKKSDFGSEYLGRCLLSDAKINQSFTKVIDPERKEMSEFPSSPWEDLTPPAPSWRCTYGRPSDHAPKSRTKANAKVAKWYIRNLW